MDGKISHFALCPLTLRDYFTILNADCMLEIQRMRFFMKEYLDVLAGCPLFDGVERADITAMLGCLDGRAVEVRKGEAVFNEGDPARFMGIVLAGSVQILRYDYY